VEIRRTIHRVDPGIACAVHSADEKGEELFRVKGR
jgi:Ni,Fe-hydrogenase I large subunit